MAADITSVLEDEDTEPFGYNREVVWPSLGLTRVVPLSDEEVVRFLLAALDPKSGAPSQRTLRFTRKFLRLLLRLYDAPPDVRVAQVLRPRRRGPKPGRSESIALHYVVVCELRGSKIAAHDVARAWGIGPESVLSYSRLFARAREVMEYLVDRGLDAPLGVRSRRAVLTALARDLRAEATPRGRRSPKKLLP